MSTEYTPIQEIAAEHTEAFIFGLDAGLEVVKQYHEMGVSLEDFSPESDAFQTAANKLAASEHAQGYGEKEFTIAGMGIVAALEEEARMQGVKK